MAACISAAASAGIEKPRPTPRRCGRLEICVLIAALALAGCAPGAAAPQPTPNASAPDHDRRIINDGGDGGGSM